MKFVRMFLWALVGIFAALNNETVADTLKTFGGAQFSTFKPALADLAVAKLGPIGAEMNKMMADKGYIDGVLSSGADKARAIAGPIYQEVKKIVGFVR